jgi:hypothetical protein
MEGGLGRDVDRGDPSGEAPTRRVEEDSDAGGKGLREGDRNGGIEVKFGEKRAEWGDVRESVGGRGVGLGGGIVPGPRTGHHTPKKVNRDPPGPA